MIRESWVSFWIDIVFLVLALLIISAVKAGGGVERVSITPDYAYLFRGGAPNGNYEIRQKIEFRQASITPVGAADGEERAGVLELVRQELGADWERVARCESGGNSRAFNGLFSASGTFQFLPGTFAAFNPGGDIWSLSDQIAAVRTMVERLGLEGALKHWSASEGCWR